MCSGEFWDALEEKHETNKPQDGCANEGIFSCDTVDGRNPAPPLRNHETPLPLGIYRRINISGFLGVAGFRSFTVATNLAL